MNITLDGAFFIQITYLVKKGANMKKNNDDIAVKKNMKLKLARVEKDLSQDELSILVGSSRQTIQLIEAGKYNPTIKLCIKIAEALDKTLDELFWEEKK